MSDKVELTAEQKVRQVELTRQIIDKINMEERVELMTLRSEVKVLRMDIADLKFERDDLLRQAMDSRRDCVVANRRLGQCLTILRKIHVPSQCSFDRHETCRETPCLNAEIEKLLKYAPPERIPGLGELPPENQTVVPPSDGWRERTYYVADVAVNRYSQIWRAIFYSGFLERGIPAGYNAVLSGASDGKIELKHLHYLRVLFVVEGIGGGM